MVEVVVEPYNIRVEAQEGERLYDTLKRAGIPFRTECGGRGICGRCRVILRGGSVTPATEAEKRLLGAELLSRGYRLACQTKVSGPVRLLLPPESRPGALSVASSGFARSVKLSPLSKKRRVAVKPPSLENPLPDADSLARALGVAGLELDLDALRELPAALRRGSWEVTVTIWRNRRVTRVEPGDASSENLGVAVDVGTTKIVVHLVDLNSGRSIGEVFSENPQLVYGDDIVSRLRAALDRPENLEDMRRLAAGAVDNLVKAALLESAAGRGDVDGAVIVGNTVMHHLLLGIDVTGLSFSPFVPSTSQPIEAPGRLIGLTNVRAAYFPPLIAGYVGSDALADVIAVGLHLEDGPSMLIDIGTNTEILLNTGSELLACSTPSGPAFEGGHIKYGMKAMVGAISSVSIEGDAVHYRVIGDARPMGLAGSAIIDAVASLLDSGLLTERGFFNRSSGSRRIRRAKEGGWYEYVLVDEEESGLGEAITISEKDISEVRLAKAAVMSGVLALLEHAGLEASSLKRLYIAGSFGYSINLRSAVRIGLLPELDESAIKQVGNTAVEGARMMLVSEEAVEEAEQVAKRVKYVELTASPFFKKHFSGSLRFGEPR
ncbi:ASKHA domain-containing protein [Infirmifilum sp. NZ]|uniref:ASKHA domain-containing protein n=1 Tax=Infirmifilum sp. NZ TaxID=2926850 RepID=UPI00279F44DF|nr:ASKHA domain-containing protein [Infirmifilum sp. NZ]UNQ73023.1 ASKHA domain-containing protein [Infirmifilum sp. NZ]